MRLRPIVIFLMLFHHSPCHYLLWGLQCWGRNEDWYSFFNTRLNDFEKDFWYWELDWDSLGRFHLLKMQGWSRTIDVESYRLFEFSSDFPVSLKAYNCDIVEKTVDIKRKRKISKISKTSGFILVANHNFFLKMSFGTDTFLLKKCVLQLWTLMQQS